MIWFVVHVIIPIDALLIPLIIIQDKNIIKHIWQKSLVLSLQLSYFSR